MNREQIIKLAREAARSESSRLLGCGIDDLTTFANLVAQHQKELDADIADSLCRSPSYKAAEAIRGQDETTV